MPVDKDTFRATLGRFASGITIVTAVDADGRDHGMTVSAFTSLSLEPPLVLTCIARNASVFAALTAATHIGINILAADQEPLSRRFASRDGDRFDGVGYVRGDTGVALLADALANLECRVLERHDGGDHVILVAQVEHAQVREGQPILYYRGGYASLAR
ncbi:MAG: flavin reductase family protein [Gemmatimonadaceae bacterium]|nr:flavin reductase family protein [Gemmatimonadaceae bacterium]